MHHNLGRREGPRRITRLAPESLRLMHRHAIEEPAAVRELLDRARARRVVLRSGVDHRSQPRTARIAWVGDARLGLQVENLPVCEGAQLYFEFDLAGIRYFFATPPEIPETGAAELRVGLPAAIYQSERRDIHRAAPSGSAPRRVELLGSDGASVPAAVRDWTYHGLAVALPEGFATRLRAPLEVRFLDGDRRGETAHATLRHRGPDPAQDGWTRLGLAVSAVNDTARLPIERREGILEPAERGASWRRLPLDKHARAADGARLRVPAARSEPVRSTPSPARRRSELVHYPNARGEPICALVDRWGDAPGGTAVVVPPSWGRTKETMLPLAATLVKTFEQAGEPITVVRFDGTHRRGESYIEPDFRRPEDEYLGFTFSQAVEDIRASFDFLARSPEIAASRIVLVSFSLGAIEARRAVALEREGRLAGWISAVGMVDLQSGLRAVSGGVDFAYGYLRGVRFGHQELVGVVADLDRTGQDALRHGLVFLEDAKRDMAEIEIPVTWLHGRYDAWMDLERVQTLLSCGNTEKRRLIEVPTGHQMRTSREALETFQLIAQETSEMALGRRLEPAAPRLVEFARQQKAERERRPAPPVDLRAFWRDYLVGRDRSVGIELLTATAAYTEFMARQIEWLDLRAGDRLLDLGCGAGDFPVQLALRASHARPLSVLGLDYVAEALLRARARFERCEGRDGIALRLVLADLDRLGSLGIPIAGGRADAVLASLLVSYLKQPERLLQAIRESLVPGGRLVLSTLRRDADISKLYVDGIAELPPDRVRDLFGERQARDIQASQRRFLNDASRILDMEEAGCFRFWDCDELVEMVRGAGFESVEAEPALGQPPQAVVLRALAPRE